MKGFVALPIIIVAVLVLAVFLVTGSYFRQNNPTFTPQPNQQEHQEESEGGYGMKKPFFNKDGISLQYYWPKEGNFSAEETEVLLFNETGSNLEVKSFDLTYQVEGKTYPQKSGTWEKFPTKVSWERIDYINISKQYYQGQLLTLAQNEKGKLHWHMQFGSTPLDGKQTVKVKLTLLKDGQTINISEEFNRDSGIVVSKEDH